MIRINLVPAEIAEKADVRKKGFLLVIGVIAGLSIFVGVYLFKVAQLTKLNSELKGVERELDSLKDIIAQVEKLENSKAILMTRFNVIQGLLKSRLVNTYLMEDLARLVFPKIWLDSIVTKTGELEIVLDIKVSALDNYAIADFISVLDRDELFSGVSIMGFSSKEIEGLTIRAFGLSCRYKPLLDNEGFRVLKEEG